MLAAQSSPNWDDPIPNSAGNGPSATAGSNTAFFPAAVTTQIQLLHPHPHVGSGGEGASEPDAHVLGETPHGYYSNHHHHHHHQGLGQQPLQGPPDVVAQTTLFEQPGHSQGNPGPGLIAGGSGTGTSAVAGPTIAGSVDERTPYQWTGTLQWQHDMKVTHTQVTAIATKGNP